MHKPVITVSITEIISASYCEQKVIFDRRYGKGSTQEVARYAAEGEKRHLQFEQEGRSYAEVQSRAAGHKG